MLKTTCGRMASLFLTLLLFSDAGCALLGSDVKDLKAPKVTLAGLTLKDPNPLQLSFLVRLKLDNPNDLDVNLDGADVALALNGKTVAEGLSRSALTLKKRGSSELDVEVTTHTLSAMQQLLLLQTKPALDYAVSGHLHLLNWMGALGQLPFSFSGSVDRATLMRAAGALSP